MTRRAIPYPDLETEIEARMHPEAVKPRGLLRQWLWRWAAFLTGLGVGLAAIVFVMVMPVIWAVLKMRRALR